MAYTNSGLQWLTSNLVYLCLKEKVRDFQVQNELHKTDIAIIDIPIHSLFRED